jgi:lauroyl/myristoyl acyltransferase
MSVAAVRKRGAASLRPAVRASADWLRGRQALHRVVPMPAMRKAIEWRADLAYRNPTLRFQAESHLRFLLGKSRRASDVEGLVRPYLVQYFTFNETLYRPWLIRRQPVAGIENLQSAVSEGRGVIVHYLHHGQYVGMACAVSRLGFPMYAPAHLPLLASKNPDDVQLLRTTTAYGVATFPVTRSYAEMRSLLDEGKTVIIATDVRGSTPATFLGRRILCASGAWRLGMESGAPIVPLTIRPHGARQRVVVQEPIDPRVFTDGVSLQQSMLARHEPSVLAWPEAMRHPLVAWRSVPDDREELQLDDSRLTTFNV